MFTIPTRLMFSPYDVFTFFSILYTHVYISIEMCGCINLRIYVAAIRWDFVTKIYGVTWRRQHGIVIKSSLFNLKASLSFPFRFKYNNIYFFFESDNYLCMRNLIFINLNLWKKKKKYIIITHCTNCWYLSMDTSSINWRLCGFRQIDVISQRGCGQGWRRGWVYWSFWTREPRTHLQF